MLDGFKAFKPSISIFLINCGQKEKEKEKKNHLKNWKTGKHEN